MSYCSLQPRMLASLLSSILGCRLQQDIGLSWLASGCVEGPEDEDFLALIIEDVDVRMATARRRVEYEICTLMTCVKLMRMLTSSVGVAGLATTLFVAPKEFHVDVKRRNHVLAERAIWGLHVNCAAVQLLSLSNGGEIVI
eukprot:1825840-Pleurochrysis_carterae.AAC.6